MIFASWGLGHIITTFTFTSLCPRVHIRVQAIVAAAAWGERPTPPRQGAGSTIQRRSAGPLLAVQRASGGQADREPSEATPERRADHLPALA